MADGECNTVGSDALDDSERAIPEPYQHFREHESPDVWDRSI